MIHDPYSQSEIDTARRWVPAHVDRAVDSAFTHSTASPIATVAALVAIADRENVPADVLAGHVLAEVGDDIDAMHYYSLVLIDRACATRAARSVHTFWHGGRTIGDTDSVTPAPDGYTRVQSATVTRKSNKGTTYKEVTVHGRGYVGGSHRAEHSSSLTMVPAGLAYALETMPRTALGHADSLSVSRLTEVAYPDLPRYVGGDTVAWSEFASWDETRARTPRRGWKLVTTLPKVSSRGYNLTTRSIIRPDHVIASMPRLRWTAIPCVAPRDDETVWVGFTVQPRVHVDTYRATRAKKARTTDDAIEAQLDRLAEAVETVAAGKRYSWVAGPYNGHVTTGNADRPRYSITGLPGNRIRGYLTVEAFQRAIAKRVATLPAA